ncbi:glycohydrolase toxin TNT-related protein [Alteromonas sp. OM2203]|uniref:TNT domain-containing protein n=1 Tax=Alteromonas sp. OM2203 TaxID=3398817 RepID=UPI003AF3F30F
MSVDPLIQAPTNSQSLNPYSYIMNNPMSGIDPTGYCSTDDTLQGCADGLEAGTTQAITNSDGDTVGYVGKDSQGNLHMTSNGSDRGQAAVASTVASVGKQSDINSQKSIAQSASHNRHTRDTVNRIVDGVVDEEFEGEFSASVIAGEGELTASRGARRRTASSNGLQPFINAQYGRLFRQIKEINPNFNVARPQGPLTRQDIQFLESQLAQMRGSTQLQLYWPTNMGFVGGSTNGTLRPGTRIDRYGTENGFFVSPAGTPFGQRALPQGFQNSPYTMYEVLRPIPVRSGFIAPAFGQPGLGTQHILPMRVKTLRELNYIRPINE